jgi:hypothetical protein
MVRITATALPISMPLLESEDKSCLICSSQMTAPTYTPPTDHIEPRAYSRLPAMDFSVSSATGGVPRGLANLTGAFPDLRRKNGPQLRNELRAYDHLNHYFAGKRLETARLDSGKKGRVVVVNKGQHPRTRSNCRRA